MSILDNPDSREIPNGDELDALLYGLHAAEGGTIEALVYHLTEGDDEVKLTAEQAWNLTLFADHVSSEADQLQEWADNIEKAVMFLWAEATGGHIGAQGARRYQER